MTEIDSEIGKLDMQASQVADELSRITTRPNLSEKDMFARLYRRTWSGAVNATKTDAEGKFYFETDGSDYVLVATGSRKNFGGTEKYFWFHPVQRGQMNFLSNDNMMSQTDKDRD